MSRARQRLQEIERQLRLEEETTSTQSGEVAPRSMGLDAEGEEDGSSAYTTSPALSPGAKTPPHGGSRGGRSRQRLHNHIVISRSSRLGHGTRDNTTRTTTSTSAERSTTDTDRRSRGELWRTAVVSCGATNFGASGRSGKSGELRPISLDLKAGAFVVNAFSGPTYSFVIDSSGCLWGWGSGPGLVAGAKVKVNQPRPVPWPGRSRVSQLACSPHMCAASCEFGLLWVWGEGSEGQLGLGSERRKVAAPTQVDSISEWFVTAVACGERHTVCIGRRRQLDDCATPSSSATATRDAAATTATSGAGGSRQYPTLELSVEEALTRTGVGSLFTFGSGVAGQLGHGDATDRHVPSELKALTGKEDKTLATSNFVPVGVASVACGLHHTLAIVYGRDPWASISSPLIPRLYAWGWGEDGRLGIASEDMAASPCMVPSEYMVGEVLGISAGDRHSLVLTESGHTYAFGSNEFGQLGCGSPSVTPKSDIPVRVALPQGISGHRVCASGHHSALIASCGALLTWGWGWQGQLGHGVEANKHMPKPVVLPNLEVDCSQHEGGESTAIPHILALGTSHTLAILRNRQVPALADRLDGLHFSHAIALDNPTCSPLSTETVNEIRKNLPPVTPPRTSRSPQPRKSPKKSPGVHGTPLSPGWRRRTIEEFREEDALRVARIKQLQQQQEKAQEQDQTPAVEPPPVSEEIGNDDIQAEVTEREAKLSDESEPPSEEHGEGRAEGHEMGEEREAEETAEQSSSPKKEDYYFGGKHQDINRAFVANAAKRAIARRASQEDSADGVL